MIKLFRQVVGKRLCEELQATRQSSGSYTRREIFNVALSIHCMTGLPRFARNDDSSCYLAHQGCGRYFRFAI